MSLRSLSAILLFVASTAGAADIGKNQPALPLTADRIAALPADQRPAWQAYLDRSTQLRATDTATLVAEVKAAGLAAPLVPAKSRNAPLVQPAAYWAGPEAARIAAILVSFQTPAGGWTKNTDQATAPRRRGERHGYEAGYVGTIDNDGTVAQLRFLAQTIAATDATAAGNAGWRASFNRGIDYLLTAQYPNGGWPQVFPLEGGYHDAITFNDGAFINVLTLLETVAAGRGEFAFTSTAHRTQAAAAVARGIACIIASQIVVDGRHTVWCQQHDMLTLAPCAARNYEMPSQSSAESAGIMRYLMALPSPGHDVVTAVHAAAAWFQKTSLHDVVFKSAPDGSGRKLLPSPGAGPIWPRYSEIGTDRPLFGDRDLTIHYDVDEISKERRNGYGWFNDGPKRTLAHYAKWAKAHPVQSNR